LSLILRNMPSLNNNNSEVRIKFQSARLNSVCLDFDPVPTRKRNKERVPHL
jgi:hypothetical protein